MKGFFYGPLRADRRAGVRLIILTACLCCRVGAGLQAAALVEDTTAKKAVVVAAPQEVKPLWVGDKVPDIALQMMNYASPTARLSDFKGKLIILDFWATWCGSCIAVFPENERLQKEFGDKIQILLVNVTKTGDTKEKIEKLLEKQRTIKGQSLALPIVVSDTTMNAYFPHELIPHYVWIGEDGNVVAVTASGDVNDKNIQAVLDGKAVSLLTKDDDKMKVDFSTPFLMRDAGMFNDLKTFSIFTGALNMEVSTDVSKMDANGLCIGMRMLNRDLRSFFQTAYPEMINTPLNRQIVDVSDSIVANDLTNYSGTGRNYCYEFITKNGQPFNDVLYKYLKDDLSRTFHCHGHVEYKKDTCYVISVAKLIQGNKESTPSNASLLALPDFLERINQYHRRFVTDIAQPNKEVKIRFPVNPDDFAELKKNLSIAGYDVKADIRSLPYFIISDN